MNRRHRFGDMMVNHFHELIQTADRCVTHHRESRW